MSHCYYCGHGLPKNSQGYFYRIKTLKRWVYSKSLTKYERMILELAILLQSLLPGEQVKIKDHVLDDQIRERLKEQKLQVMYELLTYGICLLNQHHRLHEDHHWIAEKEDQLTALFLLQPRLCPESMLDLRTRRIYQQLLEEFYPDDFTVTQAMKRLIIPRATLQRHIVAMENAGYLERTGGSKNQGYKYNIGYWPWKK